MSLINSLSVWERKPGLNGNHRQTSEIDQRTISNNQEIFETISRELKEAQQEILVVAAWFTDPSLFELLKEQAENGLNVQIIIADNDDNKRIDFDRLPDSEHNVLRVKNVGYGIMNQKYLSTPAERELTMAFGRKSATSRPCSGVSSTISGSRVMGRPASVSQTGFRSAP